MQLLSALTASTQLTRLAVWETDQGLPGIPMPLPKGALQAMFPPPKQWPFLQTLHIAVLEADGHPFEADNWCVDAADIGCLAKCLPALSSLSLVSAWFLVEGRVVCVDTVYGIEASSSTTACGPVCLKPVHHQSLMHKPAQHMKLPGGCAACEYTVTVSTTKKRLRQQPDITVANFTLPQTPHIKTGYTHVFEVFDCLAAPVTYRCMW